MDLGVVGGLLGLQGQAESDDEAAVAVDELDMDMAVAGALVDPGRVFAVRAPGPRRRARAHAGVRRHTHARSCTSFA